MYVGANGAAMTPVFEVTKTRYFNSKDTKDAKFLTTKAADGNFVCEGRDQGTVAFPNAECKIFLTASSNERATRRYNQLVQQGKDVEFPTILRDQETRDQRDQNRSVGRLIKANDAVEVNTDGLSLEQVVDEIEKIARSKIAS